MCYYHAGIEHSLGQTWSSHTRSTREAAVHEARRMARRASKHARPMIEYWSRSHGTRSTSDDT
jgi:hypothetical protein